MTTVKEIMTRETKYVTPQSTIQEAAKLMTAEDIGFLPVGENDRLVGSITDRDIVIRTLSNGRDTKTTTVKDIMTPKCLYCYDSDTVEEAANNMSTNKVRRLAVLNENKRLVGVVTIGDLWTKSSTEDAAKILKTITKKSH
jgi:CBS domain-containing protein